MDNLCCWCDRPAVFTMFYVKPVNGDPACDAHTREYARTYDIVRPYKIGD